MTPVEESAAERERALRRQHSADRILHFPLVEHALDQKAHGGPDMVKEAEALAELLRDFAERMKRG